jgi:hypothetical protein
VQTSAETIKGELKARPLGLDPASTGRSLMLTMSRIFPLVTVVRDLLTRRQ